MILCCASLTSFQYNNPSWNQVKMAFRAKRSFVHDYFEPDQSEGSAVKSKKMKCKQCIYTCVPKDGSTTAMSFHLRQSHGISKPIVSDPSEDKDNGGLKQPSIASVYAAKRRSVDEWLTRQVALDGLTLRQLASSEFQEAACLAMRLKHFRSPTKIGNVVMEHIQKLKDETKEKLAKQFQAGERFSVVADEWTSIRNRRYINVCLKTDKETFNLGLARCKGKVTAQVTAEMVKVSKFFLCITYLFNT